MSKYYPFFCFASIVVLFFSSCKSDTTSVTQSSDAATIENAYFEDYVSPNHKWGFIDKNGIVAIEPTYDEVGEMKGVLTAANYRGKWGYIDIDGQFVIPAKYKQAYEFSEFGAFVQDFNNQWILINKSGDTVRELDTAPVPSSYGVSVFIKDGYSGLRSSNGEVIIEAKYDKITPIDARRSIVKMGKVYSIIDSKDIKLTTGYDNIYRPKNGRIRVKLSGKYGFLNAEDYSSIGKIEYSMASDFDYESTVVSINNQYQLVSSNLKRQLDLPYEKVVYVGEKMWKYKVNGKWGILDSSGVAVSSAKFDLLNNYKEGLIAFSIDELWGYANTFGLKKIPAKYQLVWDFHDGLARVIDQRGVGFINKDGKMVINDIFLEVRDFYQGKARFQTY